MTGTVVTPGNYDGVHLGHQALVKRARTIAERTGAEPAAMFFDPRPVEVLAKERAQPALTTTERRRELLLRSGASQVLVKRFDEAFAALSAEAFVQQILVEQHQAEAVVVGPDFRFGQNRSGTVETLKNLGGVFGFKVDVLSPVNLDHQRISSTLVRQKLREGDVATAASLLGHVHDIDGEVITGAMRGRTIGFPTANLRLPEVMVPADGVYAVVARLIDESILRPGIANLGVRPTVDGGRSFEVHLFDFSAEIYDQVLRVGFVSRIRSEIQFSGLDALRKQIVLDVQQARLDLGVVSQDWLRWL
ncbi:MAG: bifunctional riboflavin kinase/FAD synthetase [Myxococcota bacterium]